jgi:putative tryptophan/tyrosine transport system substrate-binding protein
VRLSRRWVVQGAGAVGLGLLAGCGLPFAAPPPAAKVHRIAFLSANPPSATNDARLSAFRQGMRDLGYVEGQNLVIEQRYASDPNRFADPAADLVRLQPEVILVAAATVAQDLLAATTTTIPIVSTGVGTIGPELVASSLAASHARPGGTVTGLSTPGLVGKQLQLLQDAAPALSRVAVVYPQLNPNFQREPFEAASRTLGLRLQFVGVGGPEDLARVFETETREHAEGLFLPAVGWINANQTRIAELALQSRLPSMWAQSDAVGRGGLMAYAPNPAAMFQRAAYYVDRILQGTSPADLPIEQPMRFDFAINLQTAQALGLTIPPHVLLQATEVIQ